MKKIRGQPKLDEAVSRVQFGCRRNFFNLIISKLDKHVVLLLINYKQLLDEVFVISGIIKVGVSVISRRRRPRLITLTENRHPFLRAST